jgi:hypothetical protein
VILFAARQMIRYGLKKLSPSLDFLYLLLFLAVGTGLFLGILSLLVAKEENVAGSSWTYIEEPRYYGIISVMIHLGVFVLFTIRKTPAKWKRVFILLLILMLPEMFRGLIFDTNRLIRLNKETYSWQTEYRLQRYADDIIRKEAGQQVHELTVITGSSYYLSYRVGLFSHAPVMAQSGKINDLVNLGTQKPTMLLAIIEEKELARYKPFLSSGQKKLAGYLNGFYFYTLHVNPH